MPAQDLYKDFESLDDAKKVLDKSDLAYAPYISQTYVAELVLFGRS